MTGTYEIIYADPPWRYSAKKVRGAAENHYPTMSIDELCALPVAELAAKDSAPIPPHRQLSAMIRIPYSPVIVKHGQGKPFKFFRQLPLQKVQTGARFRAIFRPEAHILAENPNAKEEIK